MTAFFIGKAIFTGVFWAVAFYTFMGFVLFIFPLPQLYEVRQAAAKAAGKEMIKFKRFASRLWTLAVWAFRLLAALLVAASLAGYAYTLHELMLQIFAGNDFMTYYIIGVSSGVPVLILMTWFLLRRQPSSKPLLWD